MASGRMVSGRGLAVADAIRTLAPMLKINLEIDVAGFEREVDTHMLKAFQPAVVDALNAAGEAAVDAVQKGMLTSFDRPKPFTLDGVGFYKASVRSDGGDPSVLIYVKDTTASYIDVHIAGGTRRAGDPFTTRRGPIVPGPAAPRDQFGNLPRGYTAAMMQEPYVEWVVLKPGEPPALIRKQPGRPMEVLALIVEEVRFDAPTFDFYGLATGGALDAFPQAFTDAFDLT